MVAVWRGIMTQKINIFRSGRLIKQAEGIIGEALLRCVAEAGVFLDAPCGGQGKCGKCLVRLAPDGQQVLACQTMISGDVDVYLPEEMEMEIADGSNGKTGDGSPGTLGRFRCSGSGTPEPSPCSSPRSTYGVAFDIGTTTIVAHLMNIETCERMATVSGINAQRPYGADVVSRIQYSAENGHETLTKLHHYFIRTVLGIKIRTTFSAAHRQGSEAILESLLKSEKLENAQIHAGMKPYPAFVGTNSAVHLHTVTAIDFYFAAVV